MSKRIEFGDRVQAVDGRVGMVEKVIVDPDERKPGYLVVKRGRLRPRRIVVPVSLVDEVSAGQVTLSLTRGALDDFPDYEVTERHGEYKKPMPVGPRRPVATYTPPSNAGYMALRRRNVPASTVPVEKGMLVKDAYGVHIGRVVGLLLDPERRTATHILLQRPAPMTISTAATTQHFVVPVALVDNVQEGEIHLRITHGHVSGLAVFEPTGES